MFAALVVCDEVTDGLRASEATVAIRSRGGRKEYLPTERDLLYEQAGKYFLEIGVVHKDPKTGACLIEFPHEADSGANRIWIDADSLIILKEGQKVSI